MSGERETPSRPAPFTTPALDPALQRLTRRRMSRDARADRAIRRAAGGISGGMQPLEPRLLMAGDVVYALNAGGVGFTDANGVVWVNDTPFTNQAAANSSTASTTSTINRSHPSVPPNTSQQLLQTERYDAGTGEEMAYAFNVANGTYEVDLYFADTFSGTQGVGQRVFDIQLEGQTLADNFDIVAEAGAGYKAVVKTLTVAVNDGVLDLTFLHEVENPAVKGILVRTVDVNPPTPVAPVVDLNGAAAGTGSAATFVAGGSAVALAPAATLTDADSTNLASLTVTLTNRPDGNAETLAAVTTGTPITQSYANGVLTLTGSATKAQYQSVLRSVTYNNTAATPNTTGRTINVVANDGALASNVATTTLSVQIPAPPTPGAVVYALNAGGQGFTDANGVTWTNDAAYTNQAAAASAGYSISRSINLTDPSLPAGTSQQLLQSERYDPAAGAEMTYTLPVANGEYQVELYFAETYTGTQAVGKRFFDVQLEGTTVLDNYDVFADVGADKGVVKKFTVNVTDGQIDLAFLREIENPAIKGILIREVNVTPPTPVAPVLDLNGAAAGTGAAVTFVAGNGPVAVATPAALLTDADSATLSSLTVTLANTPNGASETLDAIVTGTGITKAYANGTLTLTGVASVANYQAVLRSVSYQNTANPADAATRLVNFVANDGALSSNTATSTITVQNPAVQAAPALDLNGPAAGANTTATFTVGGSPVAIVSPAATLTDADSATLTSVVAKLDIVDSQNIHQLLVDTAGTSVTATQTNGTLTLTGGATVAEYQTVLRTLRYNNTSANAQVGQRVITFVAYDGLLASNSATATVQITTPVVTPGAVVYALNAGGASFTDANGVQWVNDTAFTNQAAAVSSGYAVTNPINLSDPSIPAGTAQQLLQTERYDSGSGEEMTYALNVANGAYQVDLYFAENFSGTQGLNKRVFDVQLEGATVLDDYDVFADVGGYKGVVKTFNVNVADGVLDVTFLHEIENPAVKGILVRSLDVAGPAAPVLDLDALAAGANRATTFDVGQGPVNVAAPDATLTDADSATLESLTVFLAALPDGASERLDADVTGTAIAKSYAGGVLSLTGTATVAEYQAVLRSVTYDNLAASPDLSLRSINFIANDGTADSNTAIASVTVNDDAVSQPGTLVADVSTIDFNNAQTGVVERITVTLTHPGAAIDQPVTITGTNFTGVNAADFGDLFTSTYGESVTLQPGESLELVFYILPSTTGTKFANVEIQHTGSNALSLALEANAVAPTAVDFGTSVVAGLDAVTPTTLQWGPDNRLYVGTLDGLIHAYTITRNAANDYAVTATETITLVQDIPNHEDNGTLNPSVDTRLITGIKVVGTASAPIIYVTSSDPRLTNGTGSTIDTNSGIVSKLTQNAQGQWQKVDLVRGLPRSAVDHAPHALQLLESSNTLLVAVGGLTNAGAPGNFFGNLPEYALSAGILSLDLTALEALPTQTDANGQQYKYNLPTLDDENRAGVNDAGDPFGGNKGKNQAVLVEGGPVGIFASGLRNPYDFVLTQYGNIYTTDNGPNSSIGGTPILDGNGQPTNQPNQGGTSAKDALHLITEGSYSGHPNPTRANTDNTFNTTNPQTPVYDGYTEPGTYQQNGTDGALALFDTSTNGIVEYTGTAFGGALNGDLLTVTIDGKLTRLKLSPDGTSVIDSEILFNNSGVYPLDLTAVGDDHPFGGTIWVADLYADPGQAIRVYEPNAGSGQGTPEDLDGDGYLNQDEIDNGTNPNSAGDTPSDNDLDFVSDLNDLDDDNDTQDDLNDPFQIDDTNGNNTNAPFILSFDNDDLNRGGLLDLGFTGVMTNGTTNYRDQFDFANLTAGSAAGVLTIDAVGPGTALGNTNTQENAFQFGLNLDPTSTPVTIQTRINSAFDNATPAAGQRAGIYFGTGDQDNYIAIFVEGNGTINTVTEINGVATFGTADVVGANFTDLNLYLTVDPATQTVQAAYSFGTGPITNLTGTTGFPIAWLQSANAPAVGVIATSSGGEAYSVTYDFIRVDFAEGADPQQPFNNTPHLVGQRVEAEHFDLGGNGIAYLDLTEPNEGGLNIRPGEFVDLESTSDIGGGANVGYIEAGEWLEYTFDIAEAGTYSADFRVALESGTGSQFHLEIDGQNISGPLTLPVTGDWQGWQTVTANNLQLAAGPVTLRVVFDTASTGQYAGNFNWLQLNNTDFADALDLGDSGTFNFVDAPPFPGGDRFEAMTITIGSKVYVFGGFADFLSDKFNDVRVYDIATNAWSQRGDMPTTVNHLNAVYDEATGLAWFVGGYKGEYPGEETAETWIYDVANDTWTAGPDLPAERSAGQTAIVGRDLHYIGGFVDRSGSASTDHYILDLDNVAAGWTTSVVSAPASRGHASVAVLGTDIYVIGGTLSHDGDNTDLDTVFKLDTLTNTWSQVADLPFGWSHSEPGTFTANGRIFMAGGRSNATGRAAINDFYMYDPDADAWIQLPDLPENLLGGVITVLDHPVNGQALYVTTGVFQGLNGTSEAWAADFDDIWDALPNLPAQLGEIAAGVINNKLYVVGDGNNGTFSYNLTTGQWANENRNRPVPAKDQLAEVVDGKLYVMGGISYSGGRKTFNDVQIYDPVAKTWSFGTDIPTKIFAAQTTVIDGKIYLSGGVTDANVTTNKTYVYDPAAGPGGTWTQLADAPLLRNSAATGTDGSKMYIFGGRVGGDAPGNGFTDVMIYDPATNTWESTSDPGSTLAALPQARGGIVNAPFINGEFYVIGGETDNDPNANAVGLFDRVDIYNPLTNTWRQGTPMPTARHGIYPVGYAGGIYIAGGGVVKGASNSNVFDVYFPDLV